MSTWQFVTDFATATPTVRLDINAGSYAVDVANVNLDPSEYDQSWANSPMIEGSRLVWERATNRVLVIPLHITTTTADAQATAIENLGRQLAVNNILKVQFGNTNPIFYRTFGNPKYASKIRRQMLDSNSIVLTIVAEPYAYGPRVEVTGSPFTVSNDPAAGTNPCQFDITGVLGDAPTPLLLFATSTGASGTPSGLVSKWSHFATRRRGTPGNYSNLMQAEGMLPSTDTATAVDATMSGGNKMSITFATNAALTVRLSDQFPANDVATVEARGTYRVYAKVKRSDATSVMNVQFRYGTGAVNHVSNDVETLAATTNAYWVDLGLLPVPAYSDPETMGFSGVQLKAKNSWVALYAQRVSGTGTLDVDCLYFMPADEPTTLITKFPSTDTTYAIDGTHDSGGVIYALHTNLDEVLNIAFPPQIVAGGGFPAVIPGQTNRIHFLRNVDPTGSLDALTNTTTFRAFYWPRWRGFARP